MTWSRSSSPLAFSARWVGALYIVVVVVAVGGRRPACSHASDIVVGVPIPVVFTFFFFIVFGAARTLCFRCLFPHCRGLKCRTS
jgi:hypothetical protein